jgi:DnaJ-class molecular chaperone
MVKGLDYYDVLGLTRDADNLAIRRAFRKLALHFHPEINKDESAAQEFNRMCEAYDVLSNPRRKGFYDLYGEDALKDGVPEGQGDGNLKGLFGLAPQHHVTLQILLSPGLKGSLYHFDPELTPEQVFSRFFGTANPYEALDAISSQFEAMTVAEQPMVGRNKVYTVELSLEEIFHGCLKKVSHKRKILHDNGEYTEELRFLTIDVKPGLPSGTRFLFERYVLAL